MTVTVAIVQCILWWNINFYVQRFFSDRTHKTTCCFNRFIVTKSCPCPNPPYCLDEPNHALNPPAWWERDGEKQLGCPKNPSFYHGDFTWKSAKFSQDSEITIIIPDETLELKLKYSWQIMSDIKWLDPMLATTSSLLFQGVAASGTSQPLEFATFRLKATTKKGMSAKLCLCRDGRLGQRHTVFEGSVSDNDDWSWDRHVCQSPAAFKGAVFDALQRVWEAHAPQGATAFKDAGSNFCQGIWDA